VVEYYQQELVRLYVEANRDTPEFFSRWNRFFGDDPTDDELQAAMEAGRTAIVDARDPAEMLRKIAQTNGFNPAEDAALLSKLSIDELVQLFDENEGEQLKGIVEWADRIASQQGAEKLRAKMTAAIDRIAARSAMRADRLRSWGVLP